MKPERSKKDAKKYPRMVNEWWKFWNPRPAMRRAIRGLDEVIVIALTSKSVQPACVSSAQVFANSLGVFAYGDAGHFGFLCSGFHWHWAVKYASTMRNDLRYTPSDVFETLAQPGSLGVVAGAGSAVHSCRGSVMLDRSQGLTRTYNQLHDSSERSTGIVELRQAHEALDYAVRDAYDWTDLDLAHGFHETKQGVRFTFEPSVTQEILDRLLELNRDRYAEEVRRGLHDKAKKRPRKPSPASASSQQDRLGNW
ncbi:MAG TPA: hypothetical protein PKB03_04110 [Baekduia sp.]|nr:hypothetical protein [Baekduia sp.]